MAPFIRSDRALHIIATKSNKKIVALALSTSLILGGAMAFKTETFAAQTTGDIKNTLANSGYISTTMQKSKENDKLLTRRDVAELAVRLFLKIEQKTIEVLPSQDNLSDTNDPYAIAAANMKLMGPSKGKFNPNATLSRKDTITVFTNVVKGVANGSVTEGIGAEGTSTGGAAAPQGANGSVRPSKEGTALFKAGQKIVSSYAKIGTDKGMKRIDAFNMIQKLTFALKLEKDNSKVVAAAFKDAKTVGVFKAPKRGTSDLSVYESPSMTDPNRQVVMTFSGTNDPARKMTAKDVHLQVLAVLRTGKTTLTEDDYTALYNYLEKNYDPIAKVYGFNAVAYIHSGKVNASAPSDPAKTNSLKVESGATLKITVVTKKVAATNP